MPAFGVEKLMDFFIYFDRTSPQHREAIKRLYEGMSPSLKTDESYWVKAYRTKPPVPAVAADQHISDEGLKLIKNSEGLRLKAYQDSVGVWTIGYGHTAGVKPGQEVTEAEATTLLRGDVAWAENAVEELVTVKLSSGQFSALVSFVFNLGAGALGESTLLRKLNAGDFQGAAAEFKKWIFAGGQELPGLVTRRDNERRMFLNGTDLHDMNSVQSPGLASVQRRIKIQAQHYAKSCGQASVAMAIGCITGQSVDDTWVNSHYGYDLLGALNGNSGGKTWKDAGNFTPALWSSIRFNLLAGYPTIIGVNGPEFSPSGYGHIVLIVALEGDTVTIADPNGGLFRQVSKHLIETCPPHTDGKFVFMTN